MGPWWVESSGRSSTCIQPFLFKILIMCMSVCIYLSVGLRTCVQCPKSPEECAGFPELEFQAVGNCYMLVLRTKLVSSVRAVQSHPSSLRVRVAILCWPAFIPSLTHMAFIGRDWTCLMQDEIPQRLDWVS